MLWNIEKDLNLVLNKIKSFPPLVFAGETTHLKQQLSDVVDGKAFLLQAVSYTHLTLPTKA